MGGRLGSWTLAILTGLGGAAGTGSPRTGPALAAATASAAALQGGPMLSGAWTLDSYLSDNPEQIARALRLDTGQSPTDESLGGLEGGRYGGRGMGRGGYGRGGYGRAGGAPSSGRPEPISAEDSKLLQELTDAVQFAPPALTITQTGSDVTIAGGSGAAQTLHGNGKAEKQQLGAGLVERTASWEGPHLVVRYQVGHAGTLKYTYSVAPTTRQLVVRVSFDRGQQTAPFEIKLIYDPAPAAVS
jgi:hypothetical protein